MPTKTYAHATNENGDLSPGLRIALERWWRARGGASGSTATPIPPEGATTTTTTVKPAPAVITASGIDSAEAANVSSENSLTRAALNTWLNAKNYLTANTSDKGTLDSSVAKLVESASSLTRAAIISLVQSYGGSGSTAPSTPSNGPRFYAENYRTGRNDDQTIRAALQASAAFGGTFEHPIIELAGKEYQVTHGVLSDLGDSVVKAGMTVEGQGYTTLRLMTGGKSDQWFYDNGSSAGSKGNDALDHRRNSFGKFAGINFTSDDPSRANANGFRFTGIGFGHEQNYMFDHCRFHQLNVCFDTEGTLNTDSIRLYNCYGYDVNTALVYSNNQALLMEWYGTAFELVRKSAFVVRSGGGGDLKINGGSWVLSKAAGDTATYALLDIVATDNVGPGNGNFTFQGARTELRDADTMYLRSPGPQGMVFCHFDQCNLYVIGETQKPHTMVSIGDNRRVTFNRCVLSPFARFEFSSTGWNSQVMPNSRMEFYSCETGRDLAGSFTWSQYNRFGQVVARGCRPIDGLSPAGWKTAYAMDFDLNAVDGTFQPGAVERKTIMMLPTRNLPWPSQATSSEADWQVVLPPRAIITRVMLNRPGTGSSSTAYQLSVSNGDKTVVYASSSASGTFSQPVNLDVSPMTMIGEDLNARTVKLYASKLGDSTNVNGGWALVEYI